MKHNRIKSIILAGVACLSLSSCGDFLQIEPKTFVSEDNFWNEKKDIDQMVIGVYTKMQSDAYIRRCIMWGETRSDNIGEGLNCSDQTDIYRTLRENLLSTNQYTSWHAFYSVINQCNTIIARAPEVSEKDPVYTQSDVLATQAEVSFLRDLSYYYLVRAFKDVPYYTYAIQSDEEAGPIAVTSGDQIISELIVDLEKVVSNALKAYPKDTNRSYNSNCNRVTQSAIYALLADLCLWDGQYQKAADYAQRVIDAKLQEYKEDYAGKTVSTTRGSLAVFKWANSTGDGYPLYPCFSGNYYGNDFNNIFGSTGNSFESIFELAFTTNGNDNYISNSACGALYGNYYIKDGNSGKGFLAAHENVAKDPQESSQVFSHRYDCRYYANLSVESSSSSSSSTAYSTKFVNYSVEVSASTSGLPFKQTYVTKVANYSDRNWIFYRLTDVMLMQAEALIESAKYDDYEVTTVNEEGARVPLLDGDGNQVYDQDLKKAFELIWTVNRRSIMVPTTENTSAAAKYELSAKGLSRSMLRDLCIAERRRELMFEGKRWFDMLRRCHREGKVDYIKNHVPAKSGGMTPVNYEALFWPYNKNELKNNSLLEQKPYYGDSDDEGNYSSTK